MQKKTSAGLMLYRMRNGAAEILLAHPGGPFFKNKDLGAWSIPKGEIIEGEELLAAAKREFAEETGIRPEGNFIELGFIKQKSGKTVCAWAVEYKGEVPEILSSNTFEIEWPPRSGKMQKFPEIDKTQFFPIEEAKTKINPAQAEFITQLVKILKLY